MKHTFAVGRRTIRFLTSTACAVIAASTVSSVAHAQDAGSATTSAGTSASGADQTAAQTTTATAAGDAAAQGNPTGLGDIVVTARRVTENLQSVPISVGVLSKDDLVSRNIADFQSLKGAVVGLTTSRTATIGGGYVTIRGLTPVATPQPASDQGVGFFVDGVAIARSQGAGAPLADVSRVEVLRGPQGTLFGRNSSFGTINFVTNTPVDRLAASGSIEYGNYNALRATGMVNIPITDNLIARFAYRHEQIDGDVKNSSTSPGFNYVQPFGAFSTARRFDESLSNSYLAKLRYTGITGLTLEYKYDREDVNATPPSGQLIGFAPTSPLLPLLAGIYPFQAPGAVTQSFMRQGTISEDHVGVGRVRNDGHLLTAEYAINDQLTARSLTSYRRTDSGNSSDLDGGSWYLPFAFPLAPRVALPAGPLCVSCSVNVMEQHAWSEEAQLLGKIGAADFTLGGYYFQEYARFQNTYSVFAFIPYAPTLYTPTQTTVVFPLGTPGDQVLGNNGIYNNRSLAVYGHFDYNLSDKIGISAGARYTWDDRSTDDLRPFGGGLSTYHDGEFTYDGTVNYHLDSDKLFYARYATGYTSGGVDSNFRFLPEKSRQVEAGFKGEFLNRTARINTALYYTWVDNRQSTVPNTSAGAACSPVLLAAGFVAGSCPVGLFVYNLPGTTTVKGFEIEMTLNPVRGLTVTENYSYNDPHFSTGEKPRAPQHNLSFVTQYDFPRFSNDSFLSLRFDGDYRSKYYATGGNVDAAYVGTVPAVLRAGMTNDQYLAALKAATTLGDYWLINGQLSLSDISIAGSKVQLAAFVRNLNDTSKPYFAVNYGATFNGAFERPRTYGLRASFNF